MLCLLFVWRFIERIPTEDSVRWKVKVFWKFGRFVAPCLPDLLLREALCISEICSLKAGPFQVGHSQVGTLQVGTPQVGSSQVSPAHCGSAQDVPEEEDRTEDGVEDGLREVLPA